MRPRAFGSRYAKESQLSDADWTKRVERWNGENGAGFLAMDKDTACGIAGSFLDQNDRTRAHLISMWTAPTHHQRGIGRLSVNEVLNWARARNARILRLMVTSNNESAICFYQPYTLCDERAEVARNQFTKDQETPADSPAMAAWAAGFCYCLSAFCFGVRGPGAMMYGPANPPTGGWGGEGALRNYTA